MGEQRRIVRCAWLATGMLIASACARVEVHHPDGHVEDMSKAQFKAYVEKVFRRQNRVVDRLIRADTGLEGEGLERDARLLRAEETMEDACQPLVELVSAKVEGRPLELADKLEMPTAAPACDAAVRAVEALLPKE